MFEAVHVRPEGRSSLARMARTASRYGYDGIITRNHSDSADIPVSEAYREDCAVPVVMGIEVRTDEPNVARGTVGNERSNRSIVAVHGGTIPMNKFAVSTPAVDVLAHPMIDGGDLNHVLVKEAAANGVRLECNLSRVLTTSGGARVRAIQDLQKLFDLVDHYDAPYVVSADPQSHLAFRAPRDLAALGAAIGLTEDWILDGLREWGSLVERNRRIDSDSFVEPGVSRGER
ncbi:MAG: RNase P subunit p30 family protein [Natrialbaceae archaeon]|nr:RNase P subunit p30 family protein [Natrialbaceae archaeon]